MVKTKRKAVEQNGYFTKGHRNRFLPDKNSQSKSKERKNSYLIIQLELRKPKKTTISATYA
jgi:hypothetical protein